jgi:hypothetical protein
VQALFKSLIQTPQCFSKSNSRSLTGSIRRSDLDVFRCFFPDLLSRTEEPPPALEAEAPKSAGLSANMTPLPISGK